MARLAGSLITLRDQVNSIAPRRRKESDSGVVPDLRHQQTVSDHNANSSGVVFALDLTHDPANGVDMGKIIDAIIKSGDPRIWYMIFNRRIWEVGVGWQPYTGDIPHEHHAHFNTLHDPRKYDDKTKWKIGEEMPSDKDIFIAMNNAIMGTPTKADLEKYKGWTLSSFNEYLSKLPQRQIVEEEWRIGQLAKKDNHIGQIKTLAGQVQELKKTPTQEKIEAAAKLAEQLANSIKQIKEK